MISKIFSKTQKAKSDHDQKWERFERKFYITPEKTIFARSLLSQLCLCDRLYPHGVIHSLYFDTPDLDMYQNSDDGGYERDKIRIRWYDSPDAGQREVPVYLELKSKRGYASRKHRRKFLVPAERLKKMQAGNTIIDFNIMLLALSEFGYFSDPGAPGLLPVILISYERFRFVEIMTGTRLSFDFKIRSSLIIPGAENSRPGLMLEGGIIEIKGPSMDIPASLRSINFLDTDWSRFSKYASCVESQMEKPGSVGRLRPSGRTELL